MIRALVLCLFVLAASCRVASSYWAAGAGERVAGPMQSSLVVPAGWKHRRSGEELLVTRDGPDLQAIRANFQPRGVRSGRPYEAGALPSELAELYVAELETITQGQVEILANEPATVGGKPGFRLRVRHNRHAERLPIDLYEIHGVGHGDGLFVLSYGAFETHFFARDLPAFEALLGSFRLP